MSYEDNDPTDEGLLEAADEYFGKCLTCGAYLIMEDDDPEFCVSCREKPQP